jgi:predicted protein tyrosine phosphatase
MNVLFVCSKNQWRSPTAEAIYKNHAQINARSAGTSATARRVINARDIAWAEYILVMEYHHKDRLKEKFGRTLGHAKFHVLDIPDDFQFMDPDLIALIELKVAQMLGV